jgi:3-oxoacyl-[acyl-carrier protein] reductase
VILTAIHEKFSTKESLENIKNMTPLNRLGWPDDIAGTALFLASDSASYINGELIAINGGLRMD